MAPVMARLFLDDFSGLPVGPLPTDFSAAGEYHFAPPERWRLPTGVGPGSMGAWYEPMRGDWHPHAPWVVLEDDGRHRLLQAIAAGKRFPRILVAGDPDWADYTLAVRVQPLRADGFVGAAFRYRTSRNHWRFGLDGGRWARLVHVVEDEPQTVAEAAFEYACDRVHELAVTVEGGRIACSVDGRRLIEVEDVPPEGGRIGLVALTTALYDRVEVTAAPAAEAAFGRARDGRERELDALCERHPKPVLWRTIDTRGFGTGRQVRFGHLRGKPELDLVLAQNLKLLPGTDAYATVRCLTALDLEGNVLWQFGEPSADLEAGLVTCDLPVQIYDLDGDGREEVLCLKNFKFYVLEGATGRVKNVRPLPMKPRKEDQFGRVAGDAILIANLRGLKRPSDVIFKNRYNQIWALDDNLNLLWTKEFPHWTGHFAQPYDFDGDGRDELFIGYWMLGPDGRERWYHEWPDHTDEIAIGPFDPAREGPQIAIVAGETGFVILAPDGTVLHRERVGHAQRLSAARFRDDLPGLQFYVVTYWGHAGIVTLHDCRGRRVLEFEPAALGTVLSPVNWTGGAAELALLSGDVRTGGLVDGFGCRAVVFPDDGHPDLCAEALDLAGDPRDELVVWDMERLWIYTQDRPPEGGRVYRPIRYPHYNASNYRAEISLPRWTGDPGGEGGR